MGAQTSQPDHSNQEKTVLPSKFVGGPHGVGDPNDRSLRNVEKTIVIPKIMKEKAKERCSAAVNEFNNCCLQHPVLTYAWQCKKEARKMTICMADLYADPSFVDECTEIYLEERRIYRETGMKKNIRDYVAQQKTEDAA